MRQIIDTAQLQRLRDKSVKDKTVELAKQKQICAGYDNNIKALGYLVEKTSAGAAASVESLKNVSGYKGTLRKVIARKSRKNAGQHQSYANAENLTAAACEEKVVALTLDDKRREQQESATAKAQKAVDDIAVQCWLRHKLAE